MSEERGYQSKPRSGGGKKFGGGSGRPRSFGERSDRGGERRSFGDKKPYQKREGGGEGRRDFGDRPPRRDFGDKKPYQKREGGAEGGEGRRDFGDRPPRRDFGDRPPRRDFGDRPPRRDFGDKKPYQKREGGAEGGEGRRDFGDRPPRREFGDRPPRREFGDRPPRRDFGDRPPRRDFGDKKPYQKREGGEGEGRRDFGDRPPRRDFGDRPPRRDFGDKKPYKKREGDFGDRKPFDKFDRRPQKSFERYGEERPAKKDFDGTKLKSDRPSYGAPSPTYLYGVHAVTQALLNPNRKHKRLLCTEKAFAELQETWTEATADGFTLPEVVTVEKEDIERLLPRDAVHQDLLLDCEPLEETTLDDLLRTIDDESKIMILDQVTDPHNIGAILRSAAAFGAKAVVMQTLHAPEVTGVLAKTASGALEHVPMIREVNLSRAMEQLKKAGFFCIGLAEEGRSTLAQMKLSGKIALVLGAEGSGLRRLVAENCDELAKLPTQEPIGSLNVSNAAAVALYELTRK